VPNDTVDFDSNDLLNAVLQNATMDGGSLDGVSLASALDANNQDLNSVGTASVSALEAESVSAEKTRITELNARAGPSSDQSISSNTSTQINLDDITFVDTDLYDIDTTDHEIEILEDGSYQIHGVLAVTVEADTRVELEIYVNESRVSKPIDKVVGRAGPGISFTFEDRLDANDTVHFEVTSDATDPEIQQNNESGTQLFVSRRG